MQAVQQEDTPLQIGISLEGILYIILVIAALMVRLVGLGVIPLSAYEVPAGVAAWATLEPTIQAVTVPASALSHNLSVFFMALGGVDEAAVRLPAALAGLGLVFSPLLFRRELGRVPTLLAVTILAVVPSAVIPSRIVSGAPLSLLLVMLMLFAIRQYIASQDNPWILIASGLLAGVILADSGAILIILSLVIAAALTLLTDEEGVLKGLTLRGLPLGPMTLTFTLVLIIVGSGFFLVPGGVAALAESLRVFVSGILNRPPGVTPLPLLLILYEPVLIVTGLVGATWAFQSADPRIRFLAGWGVAAFVLSLLYQGGQPTHMLWVVVPFAMLTGYATRELLDAPHDGPDWGVTLFMIASVVLFSLMLFSLSSHVKRPDIVTVGTITVSIQLVLTLMWVILLLAIWMSSAALYGPVLGSIGIWHGALIVALVMAFGHSIDITFTRQANPYELALPAQAQPGTLTMLETMSEVSELGAGGPYLASVTVQLPQESVVGWAIRDFENTQFVDSLNASITSDLVITPLVQSEDPTLGSEYVGQSYIVTRQWSALGVSPNVLLEWMLYHRVNQPTVEEAVILWVREDLYRIGADESP